MLLNCVFGGFAALAIVVTLWSLAVAFHPRTSTSVRKHAVEVFRSAWKTSVAAVLVALVRLHASGAFTPPATAVSWWL